MKAQWWWVTGLGPQHLDMVELGFKPLQPGSRIRALNHYTNYKIPYFRDSEMYFFSSLKLRCILWAMVFPGLAGNVFTVLLLLLLSRFSRFRLCATPQMAAHQSPPSLGFSRQEHWSGLPFPSPMHESEKWKWSHSSRVQLLATPWTAAYQAPPSMGFSRQEYWSGVPLPSPVHCVRGMQNNGAS